MRIAILTFVLGTLGFWSSPGGFTWQKSPVPVPDMFEFPNPDAALSHFESGVEWVVRMQHPNGLVESAAHTNFVSLYDNALAALLFLKTGQPDKAQLIFDFSRIA